MKMTDTERHAWDIAIAVAKEAEARYGMRLHVSISAEEHGYKLSVVDLKDMIEGAQVLGYQFLEDAQDPEIVTGIIKDSLLRKFAEWRDNPAARAR